MLNVLLDLMAGVPQKVEGLVVVVVMAVSFVVLQSVFLVVSLVVLQSVVLPWWTIPFGLMEFIVAVVVAAAAAVTPLSFA